MRESVRIHLVNLIRRYPSLEVCYADIEEAFERIAESFARGGKLLICGNGGSAADAQHIAGELMKGFLKRRPLPLTMQKALEQTSDERGRYIASQLQGALPAIALMGQDALFTAFANDVDAALVFAQQVYALGRNGDVLMGISTSGNSVNVIDALYTAKAIGMVTVGLTGSSGGKMADICDVAIRVPVTSTPEVQELHLPVYHALCAMLEQEFFEI